MTEEARGLRRGRLEAKIEPIAKSAEDDLELRRMKEERPGESFRDPDQMSHG